MAIQTDAKHTEDALTQDTGVALDSAATSETTNVQPTVGDEQAIERAASTLDQITETVERELQQDGGQTTELGYDLPAGFCLSIVVPIYNEERTIRSVISTLYALPLPIEVIAVDDGSTDGTCAILTRLNNEYPALRVVFQETNQGKGAALRRGFSLATGSHIMVQDADLEYDPSDIPALIEPLAKDEVDVVYGSRFLEDHHKGSSFIHRLGNGLLTKASNMMTGWQLTDMETCYKVMRRSLLDEMDLEQDGFGFEVELTAKLAGLEARVTERPITYDARGWEEGKKIGWKDAVQALYCICKYR